jgi:hypothetical protein
MDKTNVLKVSVLVSGAILLDDQPVGLAELGQAMEQSSKENAVVWYYRENAAGEPPPQAMEVLKLIIANRLPVRLSSQPDFSDTVTPPVLDWQATFARAREKASEGQIVMVRPDGQHLLLPALDRQKFPPKVVALAEKMLPSIVKRKVAVIADTAWTLSQAHSIQDANQAIPFFGFLIGFGSIGHAVWVFDTNSRELLRHGCTDADVLIVDSDRLAFLPEGWQSDAGKVMRNANIVVHDRITDKWRVMNLPSSHI